MTKLRLLGAQRVKALTEILERKFADVIKEVRTEEMTYKEAVLEYAKQTDNVELLESLRKIEGEYANTKDALIDKLGVDVTMSVSYIGFRTPSRVRSAVEEIRKGGSDDVVAHLERELAERKSQLWLVETLEEATEIVSKPITKEAK